VSGNNFDAAIARKLDARGIAHVPGFEQPEKPWSKRVVEYLCGMRDYEVQRNTARAVAEMQAAATPPKTLVEELREAIGNPDPGEHLPLNGEPLLAYLSSQLDKPAAVSVAEVIRRQLSADPVVDGHNE
jgi:hypothetical protein